METRKHLAAEKKRQNTHNCAQSVVCTYCDLVGLDKQTALDIAGAYGTGMGNMEGTCGALVGAGMIVGLATKDRIKSRARMKEMMEKFQARNGWGYAVSAVKRHRHRKTPPGLPRLRGRRIRVFGRVPVIAHAPHHLPYRCELRIPQLDGGEDGA